MTLPRQSRSSGFDTLFDDQPRVRKVPGLQHRDDDEHYRIEVALPSADEIIKMAD